MKRNAFTLIFCLLFILSCLLASCNAGQSILGSQDRPDSSDIDQTKPSDQSDQSDRKDYETALRELENQILELQQSQSKNDQKNQAELERLQALLEQLKAEQNQPSGSDQSDREDTESDRDETDRDPIGTDAGGSSEQGGAESGSQDEFLYTTDGNSATITGYTGKGSTLVIPSMIDGYYVLAIADSAFEGTSFEKVIISSGVTEIGWFAFRNCSSLRSVTLPTSIEQIGYSAFSGASSALTFYAASGSFALRYAQSYGISYVTV